MKQIIKKAIEYNVSVIQTVLVKLKALLVYIFQC